MSKFAAIFVFTAFCLGAFGQQVENAIVVGTVLDPTHAAVSDATVTLTHLATDSKVEVRTDEKGDYRTPPLRIGAYSISIAADGFKRFNQRGVVLDIGDVRQVDAVLEVGQVSDSVNVEASAPLLQTSDATVGTVIGNQQITNLPLNGRDYLQLAALSSGTIPSTTTANGSQVGVSIGGQAGTAAAFLLDGLDNNTQTIMPTHGDQKEVIKPSIDAIQEFKVVTNLYSAEYGRTSSGVVSVTLKSGSNEIHGVGYEFLRNEALDAKNYFATEKSPFKRNQFGTAIGGPIIKNKLFIFGDFEIGRIRESVTEVDTVPTLAERNGIFPTTVYNPATYNAATKTRTAFAGNQIPASLWDPAAAKALSFFPLPTTLGATNNYVYASPENQDPRHWDVRGDEILSEKQNLFFRYSSQTQDYGTVAAFPAISGVGFTGAAGRRLEIDSHGFGAGYNLVISPTLVASIRAGWNYLLMDQYYGSKNNLSSLVGIPGVDQNNPGLANLTLTGFTPLGVSNTPNYSGSQDRQLSGDLTWNRGAHNIKFGVQQYWLQTNFLSSQQVGGIFNFNGQFTQNPATTTGGSALADFLLGDASSASLSNWAYLDFRTPFTDFFVQDDWKVTRHLTLNIGLRYDLDKPPVAKNNKIANFEIDADPANPQIIPSGSQGGSYADRALQGVDYHQFAPRFGFAYSLPDNKTVLQGGYGIFYSNLTTAGGMQSMEINPPNHLRVNLTTNPTNPTLFLNQGFPLARFLPPMRRTWNWFRTTPVAFGPWRRNGISTSKENYRAAFFSRSAISATSWNTCGGRSTATRRRPSPVM